MKWRYFKHLEFLTFLLTGCAFMDHYSYHDPILKLEKKEYNSLLTSPQKEPVKIVPNSFVKPIKKLPCPEFENRVSLTMTESVPLKDVLTEMARQAHVNIILNPDIEGGLYFQAYNQPFIEIVEHICELVELRYSVQGHILRIEPDDPYLKTYETPFLNLTRQKQNRISTATDVFTAMEGYSRDFDNGSSTLVTDASKSDFWEELERNLKNILKHSTRPQDSGRTSFSIHKQAGLISVFATQRQHRQITAYLEQVRQNSLSQVLIEAKIVEVSLNDDFKSGINWQSLHKDLKILAPFGELALGGDLEEVTKADKNILRLGRIDHQHLNGLVSFLNHFGTVRTLSSPRLTVMNNQSAVLKVARNHVFFKINYLREVPEEHHRALERASSQIQTVPIGLVMVVHPTINQETGRITIALRPTISSVAREKEDPAVSILSDQKKTSTVPEIQVRELDSILQVDSGGVVIMGGLMEEKSVNQHNGVPGSEEVHFLGPLLSGKEDTREVTELVILLRATVIEGPSVTSADKRIYETFTRDPRPLEM